MASLVHRDSGKCSKSEVDLFSLPDTQVAIESDATIAVAPIHSVTGDTQTPIEFLIPGSADNFIDLSSIEMYLKVKIVKGDGSNVEETTRVYPENNFLQTAFSQCCVTLNGKAVSSNSSNYAYRSYLEKLINYDTESKTSHLASAGFYSERNRGTVEAKYLANEDKIFEFYGKCHGDIFQQHKLLLNSVDVKLKFVRSPSNFHLYVGALPDNYGAPTFKIKILETELFVRQVKLSPHIYLGIERSLSVNNAKYNIRRTETRTFTIPHNLTYKELNNVIMGKLPEKILVGILPHRSELGEYTTSCFHFSNANLQQVDLTVNGVSIRKPYDLDFTSEDKKYRRAYYDLFVSNGHINGSSNGISEQEFIETSTLFSYDLTPDRCNNYSMHLNPVRYGDIGIKLKFKTALANPISVLFYFEYSDVIEITKSRTVLYEP